MGMEQKILGVGGVKLKKPSMWGGGGIVILCNHTLKM